MGKTARRGKGGLPHANYGANERLTSVTPVSFSLSLCSVTHDVHTTCADLTFRNVFHALPCVYFFLFLLLLVGFFFLPSFIFFLGGGVGWVGV